MCAREREREKGVNASECSQICAHVLEGTSDIQDSFTLTGVCHGTVDINSDLRAHTYVRTWTRAHTYIHGNKCTHTYMETSTHILTWTQAHAYIHGHNHTHTYVEQDRVGVNRVAATGTL